MSCDRSILSTDTQKKVRIVNPRYPFFLALIFIIGALAGCSLGFKEYIIALCAAVGCAGLLFIFFKRSRLFCIIAAVCFIGISWYSWAEYNVPSATLPEGKVYITGRICGPLTEGDKRISVRLDNCSLSLNGEESPLDGKTALYMNKEYADGLQYGDIITLPVSISEPKEPDGPFQMNYRAIMLAQGVRYSAFAGEAPVISGSNPDFMGFFVNLRETLLDNIASALPEEHSALVSGMLLGADEITYTDSYEQFKELGIVHIFSVSGLHVGIIAYSLMFLLKRLGASKKLGFLSVAVILLCYGCICGFSVSVTRAIIMFLIMIGTSVFFESYDSLNSLSMACIIILLINPLFVNSIGFQLSFAACYGIILFGRLFKTETPGLKGAVDTAQVTLSAQIGTLPLQFSYLGGYQLASPLANVVLVPYISVLLCYAFAAAFISLIIPPAGIFLIGLIKLPLEVFVFGADTISNLGIPVARPGYIPGALMAAYYIVMFFLSRFVNIKIKKKAMSILCIAVLLVCGAFGYKAAEGKKLEIQFLSVQNADCALIKTAEGGCYLVDTGSASIFSEYSGNSAENIVLPYLYSRGINRLDGVFLSHGDIDHSGGLYVFLDKIQIDRIYYNPITVDQREMELLAEYDQRGCDIISLEYGDTVYLDDSAAMLALYPTVDTQAGDNTSLVLMLFAYETKVLFAGDAQGKDISYLSRTYLDCDILKAPHHGSSATFSKDFYDAAGADYIIASSADASESLDSFYGGRVLYTYSSGHIGVFINDNGYTVKESK